MSDNNFEFMRVEKYSDVGEVLNKAGHNSRENPPEHADPELAEQNIFQGLKKADMMAAIEQREAIAAQSRKLIDNRNRIMEYVVTYSAGALDKSNIGKYFDRAKQWIIDRHGKENLLQCAVHLDEKEPHFHAMVTPLYEYENAKGKKCYGWSAKHFTDGPTAMRQLQDDFHKNVGAPLGLDRGIEKSSATHQETRRWRGENKRTEEQLKQHFMDVKLPINKEKRAEKIAEEVIGFVVDRRYDTERNKVMSDRIAELEKDKSIALDDRDKARNDAIGLRRELNQVKKMTPDQFQKYQAGKGRNIDKTR